MVTGSNDPKLIELIRTILESSTPHEVAIPDSIHDELLRKGAVLYLQQDASDESIRLLAELAASATDPSTREASGRVLATLAENHSQPAIDALYRLALEVEHAGIRQLLAAQNWQPSRPTLKALLGWLAAVETNPDANAEVDLLTQAFFEDAPAHLRERILARAALSPRYRGWGRLMAALSKADSAAFHELTALYPALSQIEQRICLSHLQRLAFENPAAQEVICRLFIEHGDQDALAIAQKCGYLPSDAYAQALFYFLAGDQEHYQQLDFDHNLLVTAYEVASRALRRRLLAYSRQTGRVEWLRAVSQAEETRWLSDLTDSDWSTALQRLLAQERHGELWRLAQVAPPAWSAVILASLHQAGWQPGGAERENFQQLAELALACWHKNIEVKPKRKFRALSDDLICLKFHPQAHLLAAGSRGQPIQLWRLQDGESDFPGVVGPASTTRAILFSQDGELIVAANGDQRIRIFRHASGQLIKTLEGHRSLIRALELHPGGRILLSAGFDGMIRLWRFPIGTEIKRLQSDVEEIFSLAVFGGGDMLASAGAGGNISIWSMPEGNFLRTIPSGSEGIVHLDAVSGSELLAGAGLKGVLNVWNGVNGNLVRAFSPLQSQVSGLQFHPNEHLIVASAGNTISILNLSNGETITTLKGHSIPISTITLSEDGRLLASADDRGTVILWDLAPLIWFSTPYQPGSALPLGEVAERLLDRSLPDAEKSWLMFTAALWKWIRRYEIEISEPMTIKLGEFDIEL